MRRELIRLRRQKHPRYPWVCLYWEGDVRRKKFFTSERQGKAFEAEWRRKNEGRPIGAAALSEAEWRAVSMARASGVDLGRAVETAQSTAGRPALTVQEAIEERLQAARARGTSDRQVRLLRIRLERFASMVPGRTVAEVGAREIGLFLGTLHAVSAQTRLHYFAAVKGLFLHALRMGWIVENPMARVTTPRAPVRQRVAVLTPPEFARLLEAADPELRWCLALGGFAGLRRAEIERLTWERVYRERGLIDLGADITKKERRRLVKIEPALAAWLDGAPANGRVNVTNYLRRFDRALRGAGWRGHLHWTPSAERAASQRAPKWPDNALRHSFASYHLAAFRDPGSTALELGHRDTKVLFEHYREVVTAEAAAEWWALRPHY